MIIDSHTHLDLPDFDDDRDQVLVRARDNGIGAIINMGVDLESSRNSLKLAQEYPEVFTAVGIHPNDITQAAEADLRLLAKLASAEKVVAIGEIGLDFHRMSVPKQRQLEVFQQQLDLSIELGLPAAIHCRQAHDEAVRLLENRAKTIPAGNRELGVFHCFSGDMSLARRYIELGFLISLAGPVTYPSSPDTVEVARELPLDKLLVETDSPFLAPQSCRGQRNEPSYISLVVERIARSREVPAEVVTKATTRNAIRLFHLPNN